MNIYTQIHEYIQAHKNEIVSKLMELVKIPSVRGEAEDGAPFGKNCKAVLEKIKKLYEKEGFETDLNQNGGYLLSYYGKGKRRLGIFAHADVVPVSDDWTLTNPFEPVQKDGCIIGRGTLDDKSGVIISLYCAKMFKELDIPFGSRLECYAGVNEESGMQDIKNYLSHHNTPDFSLVADTAFPLYRGNKGRVLFSLESTVKFSEGISIEGGTGATVIGDAFVRLPFNQSLFDEISSYTSDRISSEVCNGVIIMKAKGIPKHSALPEGSLNAVSLLAGILRNCDSLKPGDKKIFDNLYDMSGCHYGECFGIESENEEFGKLTCVLSKVTTENQTLTANFNIRYGTSISTDAIIENITAKASALYRATAQFDSFSTPHSLPKDNVFVKELLEVYKTYKNKESATAYVNAGGTYRQYLKNAVEIGTTTMGACPEGLCEGHGGVHQPDECINIDGLLEAIELTMLMILKCDKITETIKLSEMPV